MSESTPSQPKKNRRFSTVAGSPYQTRSKTNKEKMLGTKEEDVSKSTSLKEEEAESSQHLQKSKKRKCAKEGEGETSSLKEEEASSVPETPGKSKELLSTPVTGGIDAMSDLSESTPSQPPKKNRRFSAVAGLPYQTLSKTNKEKMLGTKEEDVSKSTSLKEEETGSFQHLQEEAACSSVPETPGKSKGVEEDSSKFKAAKLAKAGRCLWVRVPSGNLVLLHIDHVMPSDNCGEIWYWGYEDYLKTLRAEIEAGDMAELPDEFVLQVQLYDGTKKNKSKNRRRIQHYQQAKQRYEKLERKIENIDENIRYSLQQETTDLQEALKYLDEMLMVSMDALMLKKRPDLFSTIYEVLGYVGNFKEWKLTPEEEREFRKSAKKIREKGQKVMIKFCKLLGIDPTGDFKQHFRKIVDEFDAAIERLPAIQTASSILCDPTAEYFADAVKIQTEVNEMLASWPPAAAAAK